MAIAGETPHLTQLTSLRGVACMIVLFGHVVQVFNYSRDACDTLPMILVNFVTSGFNAGGAVVLFFVLSGCVLSLSLQRATDLTPLVLQRFYLKRAFRIYPMLWVSLPLSIAGVFAARQAGADGVFVDWLSRNVQSPVDPLHLVLSSLGAYTRLNGPTWSLRVELGYSAIFPVLFLLARGPRLRWWALVVGFFAAVLPIPHEFGLSFGFAFLLGAMIPYVPHGGRVGAIRQASWIWLLVAVPILLYDRSGLQSWQPREGVLDVIEALASALIVRDLYGSGRSYAALTNRFALAVGNWSYSVYLLHLPIVLLVYSLAQRFVGRDAILGHPTSSQLLLGLSAAALSLAVSALSYRLIELPAQKVGRRAIDWLAGYRIADCATAVAARTPGQGQP